MHKLINLLEAFLFYLTGSKTLKPIPRDLQDLPGAGQQVERWNMMNLEKGIAIALGCLVNDET